jgi:hypothetical protein
VVTFFPFTKPVTVIFQATFFAVGLTVNWAEIVPVPVNIHDANWAKLLAVAGSNPLLKMLLTTQPVRSALKPLPVTETVRFPEPTVGLSAINGVTVKLAAAVVMLLPDPQTNVTVLFPPPALPAAAGFVPTVKLPVTTPTLLEARPVLDVIRFGLSDVKVQLELGFAPTALT